ncbi:Protein ALP1-like like protein [Argiope bruennichi]|uniref:Protein ALP1-like like protein n=1 Tax=Argiope bruennichi TaxID=94029 RepID=A0A8T0ESK1_ARGBR|nr:Protein ALP1-like like protein [Argiope bruennichi]
MKELALEDAEGYRRSLRMNTASFEFLLSMVSPYISGRDTNMRIAITAGEKLAVTLRYLASGETQSSLSFQFRITLNTISGIIKLVCNALVKVLSPNHLHVPSTKIEYEAVSADFYTMWQFPQCIGALDGKHIKISPPPNSGSLYYNYKGDFSIALMALVDANLKFLFVDVGTNGRISDGEKCKLKSALDKNALNIPVANTLPLTNTKVPYVIVAGDAFPLSFNIMIPYPGRDLNEKERIFNYRLSRARRVSENAFGILAARFQIFKQRILTTPMNATKIVLSCCALHNFLISNNSNIYIPPCSIDVELIENKEIQGVTGGIIHLKPLFHY